MVSTAGENVEVYDVRLSSVVPASITGEDKVHELSNTDLMMKLHYVKGIYFFNSEAARGLSISDLKKPMFECLGLALHSPVSGRIRKSEDGRPFIKCNDTGVRVAEAKCSRTLDEWLAFNDDSLNDQLVYSQFLGPDSGFTPLVFVQFTWFKCGGISVGLSWANIVGDAFSASHFINMWGQILTGQVPPDQHLDTYAPNKNKKSISPPAKVPLSIQRVQLEPVGGHWLISSHQKMRTHSFHVTGEQLNRLTEEAKLEKPFEVISAVLWKSLAKTRGKVGEPKVVTLVSSARDAGSRDKESQLPSNSGVVISTVEAVEAPIAQADLADLARLVAQNQEDETSLIEQAMDQKGIDDRESRDFILYGARLTFVNLEKMNIYGLKMRGHRPVFASYSLSGVGDEGAVLVLPGPPPDSGEKEWGRVVNLILPENQLEGLKCELRNDWGIN